MKRIIALSLACAMLFTGCSKEISNNISDSSQVVTVITKVSEEKETKETEISEIETTVTTPETVNEVIEVDNSMLFESAESVQAQNLNYTTLNDPELLQYVEDTVYSDVVSGLDSDEYFVENVDSVYISKEYLEELSYNSQENVYFGYTLSDIVSQWGDSKYIFTVDENGETVVQAFENYDDTYDKMLRNVAIGAGVILVCVTVSAVTGGLGAPAVSMIFAASAKTGTIMALSSGALGGAATAITCGLEGKSVEETLKESALSASEGFMWGAIAGAVVGGATETIALSGATTNGLTLSQVAAIQKESNYPLDVIKGFKSMEQYNICKEAGLVKCEVNGRMSLIRNIDLNFTDESGLTNLERMKKGLAALDSNGQAYELHHIGQQVDSTLAILTKAEHMQGGNNTIWHELDAATKVHGTGNTWDVERIKFWKKIAEILEGIVKLA